MISQEVQIFALLIFAAHVVLNGIQALNGRRVADTKQIEAETNRENVVTAFATTFESRSNALQEQLFNLNGAFNLEKGRYEVSEQTSAERIAALETQQQTQKKESDDERAGYEKRISELEAEQKKLHDTIDTLNKTVAARDETIALQDKALAGLHEEVRKLSELVAPFIATQIAAVPIPNETNNAAIAAESSQHENPT